MDLAVSTPVSGSDPAEDNNKERRGRSTRTTALSSPDGSGDDDVQDEDGEEEREALDMMEMLKKEEEMLSPIKEKQKQINPKAKVSVKLVAEAGIDTVASGVAKGNAEIIQTSIIYLVLIGLFVVFPLYMFTQLMERFSVSVEHSDTWDRMFKLAKKIWSPGNAYVEGDASSGSYFLAGAAITGGTITGTISDLTVDYLKMFLILSTLASRAIKFHHHLFAASALLLDIPLHLPTSL
ncbi:5-enol-pyruvylshikimate-phosphate synthase [Tanacetum coccineum]